MILGGNDYLCWILMGVRSFFVVSPWVASFQILLQYILGHDPIIVNDVNISLVSSIGCPIRVGNVQNQILSIDLICRDPLAASNDWRLKEPALSH